MDDSLETEKKDANTRSCFKWKDFMDSRLSSLDWVLKSTCDPLLMLG